MERLSTVELTPETARHQGDSRRGGSGRRDSRRGRSGRRDSDSHLRARIALIHGFTQNAHTWGAFGERLSEAFSADREVTAVDLPGHGGSSSIRSDLWQAADFVADACGPADYVGYSLGGRVLLHLLIGHPGIAKRAVLIGATGGMENPDERAERIRADEVVAKELDAVGDRRALERFLVSWLEGPLFKNLDTRTACLDARLENDAAGLASSLRLCGTGTQEPLWERLVEIEGPVLVLAGEEDDRFTAIGHRLADCIGENATFRVVPGAGHACHLERPDETAEIVEEFLSASEVP